jgi:hypothetical protein
LKEGFLNPSLTKRGQKWARHVGATYKHGIRLLGHIPYSLSISVGFLLCFIGFPLSAATVIGIA